MDSIDQRQEMKKMADTEEYRSVSRRAIKKPRPSVQSESYQGPLRKHDKKQIKLINHMSRQASATGADVMQSGPTFYHPDFEPSSLMLPKEPVEINSWARYFYKYDPLVATAIDSHSELPLSKIRLSLPDTNNKDLARSILTYFENEINKPGVELYFKLLMMGVEYYKLGNVFIWVQFSEDSKNLERITLLDPDYIEIEKLQYTNAMVVELVPNERMQQIFRNGPDHPKTGVLYRSVSSEVWELVKNRSNIILPSDPRQGSHCVHIARKMSDYEVVGTGLIERNFKALVYKDRLRQSQDAIAMRHLTPKHLIWSEDTSNADVEAIREQIDAAFSDPDYAIITNFQLHWDLIGTGSGLHSLDSEWNWINDELFIGLMINKSMLLGEGSFANGQTVLEVLSERYAIDRARWEVFIEEDIFTPIAKANGWIEKIKDKETGEEIEKILIPKVMWNSINLVDDTPHKQMLSQMAADGKLDARSWLEYFNFDPDIVMQRLKELEWTPLDPFYHDYKMEIIRSVAELIGPHVARDRAEELGIPLPKPDAEQFEGVDAGAFGAPGGAPGGGLFGHSDTQVEKLAALPHIHNTIMHVAKMVADEYQNGKLQRSSGKEVNKEADNKEADNKEADNKEADNKEADNKEADTVEDREKRKRRVESEQEKNKIKENIGEPEKRVGPQRKDLRDKVHKIDINSTNQEGYDDLPLVSPEAVREELKEELEADEKKYALYDGLRKLGAKNSFCRVLDEMYKKIAKANGNLDRFDYSEFIATLLASQKPENAPIQDKIAKVKQDEQQKIKKLNKELKDSLVIAGVSPIKKLEAVVEAAGKIIE